MGAGGIGNISHPSLDLGFDGKRHDHCALLDDLKCTP